MNTNRLLSYKTIIDFWKKNEINIPTNTPQTANTRAVDIKQAMIYSPILQIIDHPNVHMAQTITQSNYSIKKRK